MAISKKSVAVGVLILAGLVAAWKFMSKPFTGSSDKSPVQSQPKKIDAQVKKEATPSTTETKDAVVKESSDTSRMVTPPTTNTDSKSQAVAKEVSVSTTYESPAGTDPVAFSVTVDKEGVITDAKLEVLAKDEISVKWQENVARLLPQALKGKKLSELKSIDKIGGSSLTTEAFNVALPQLKAKL